MNSDLFTFNGWRFEAIEREFVLDLRDAPAHYWRISVYVKDPQGLTTFVEVLFDYNFNHPPTAEDVWYKLRQHTSEKFDAA